MPKGHQLQKLIKMAVDTPSRIFWWRTRKEARTGANVEKDGGCTGLADQAEENEAGEEESGEDTEGDAGAGGDCGEGRLTVYAA